MNTVDKPTRLRFTKLSDQDIWRTKPLFTASGYRYAEIEKKGDNYNWKVNAYPDDTVLTSGTSQDFHSLKIQIKEELKKVGCVFMDEVRMKSDENYVPET